MRAFKANEVDPYIYVDRRIIDSKIISITVKGVLCYIMCQPKDYHIDAQDIANHSTDSVSDINRALNELVVAGYIGEDGLQC